MNMIKIKTQLIRSIVAGIALMVGHSFAALISITPASSEVYVGDKFSVDIMISELSVNEDLSTFDIELGYDPTVLELSKYNLSNELGNLSAGDAWDLSALITPGQLNLSSLSLLDDFSKQGDAFKLASVTFSGIAIGTSALTLSVNTLGDAIGESISSTTQDGSVNSVPEASTVMLFSSGLLVLAAVSFRKRLC